MKKWISEEFLILIGVVLGVLVVYGGLILYLDYEHTKYIESHPEVAVEVVEEPVEETDEGDAMDRYAAWWYYQNFILW